MKRYRQVKQAALDFVFPRRTRPAEQPQPPEPTNPRENRAAILKSLEACEPGAAEHAAEQFLNKRGYMLARPREAELLAALMWIAFGVVAAWLVISILR